MFNDGGSYTELLTGSSFSQIRAYWELGIRFLPPHPDLLPEGVGVKRGFINTPWPPLLLHDLRFFRVLFPVRPVSPWLVTSSFKNHVRRRELIPHIRATASLVTGPRCRFNPLRSAGLSRPAYTPSLPAPARGGVGERHDGGTGGGAVHFSDAVMHHAADHVSGFGVGGSVRGSGEQCTKGLPSPQCLV